MNSQKLFTFSPLFKQTLWGGTEIMRKKGLQVSQQNVGESWELSGIRGSESVVTNGPSAGKTLTDLLAERGAELVGKRIFSECGGAFPLLVKFIDANDELSVQVHPDEDLAQRRHGCHGKTEMWYVVDAHSDAHLMSGFSKEISVQEYEQMVIDCTLPDVLRHYEVKPGDVFYIPAGRVHNIGAGCFICEIQQSSDITYRIYDFGRTDQYGKSRPLHIEEAKAAIDFRVSNDVAMPSPVTNEMTELVASPYFTTSLCRMNKVMTHDLFGLDSFVVVICTRGSCTVRSGDEVLNLSTCHTLLAAASCTSLEIQPKGEADVLLCHL